MVSINNQRVSITLNKELLNKYYQLKGSKLPLSEICSLALKEYLKDVEGLQ